MELPRFPSGRKSDDRSVDELIAAALAEPGEDSAWDAISALNWRGSRDVFDRAEGLCASLCAVERKLGAAILGQLGLPDRTFPEACLAILLAMLETEQDHDVLASVLIALSHLKDPGTIVPASRFRDHVDPEVRYGVVFAITGHENPLAVETLIGLTSDQDADVRDWACFGLGTQIELDTPALREALAGRLGDEHDDTRCEALVGLALRRDGRVIPPLIEALTSESVWSEEIEAASLIADARLHRALVALRGWWDVDEGLLEDAILACSPDPGGSSEL